MALRPITRLSVMSVGTRWRHSEEHHISSIFDVLSWKQFDDMQLDTSARQTSKQWQRDCGLDGSHELTIRVCWRIGVALDYAGRSEG